MTCVHCGVPIVQVFMTGIGVWIHVDPVAKNSMGHESCNPLLGAGHRATPPPTA